MRHYSPRFHDSAGSLRISRFDVQLLHPDTMHTFVAIDFETATTRRDSACAVGLAAGFDGRIVLSRTYLIRPPTEQFTFTDLHGLGWEDVRDAPTFAELWPTLRAWIDDVAFVAAHYAPFDRSVLHACCARYRVRPPRVRFALHRAARPHAVGNPPDEAARRLLPAAHPAPSPRRGIGRARVRVHRAHG